MRSAPSFFIAFFFALFGITNVARGTQTFFDVTLPAYERPVDIALIFIGIVGWGAIAAGFSMMTTQRLLNERARNLRKLEESHPDAARRVIFMSGGAFSPGVEAFLRSMQHRSIAKPFDIPTLRRLAASGPPPDEPGVLSRPKAQ